MRIYFVIVSFDESSTLLLNVLLCDEYVWQKKFFVGGCWRKSSNENGRIPICVRNPDRGTKNTVILSLWGGMRRTDTMYDHMVQCTILSRKHQTITKRFFESSTYRSISLSKKLRAIFWVIMYHAHFGTRSSKGIFLIFLDGLKVFFNFTLIAFIFYSFTDICASRQFSELYWVLNILKEVSFFQTMTLRVTALRRRV